jgi:putative transposase
MLSMARPLRMEYPEAWHHVMNRSRKGEVIFRGKDDYYFFVDLLKEIGEVWKARIAAYCIMTNHYHLLIQTPDANLSRCMRHINGVYTQYNNRKYSTDGQLFRGRYKSILIDSDSYLLELVRYIHRNPLEAGVVEDLNSFDWSSHRCYLSNAKKCEWLYKGFVLKIFSENSTAAKKKYKEFVFKETPEEINRIFDGKKWPSVIGSDEFIARMQKRFFNKKRHKEIPESKILAPEVSQIKEAVRKAHKKKEGELLYSRRGARNEARNMAIYLTRYLRGSNLTEIGKEFNVGSYSTVSTIIDRMKDKIARDRRVSTLVEQLKDDINMSQLKT